LNSQEKIIVLIVAAGGGTRLGSEIPKQYIKLQGRTILAHSIAAFAGNSGISGIQVVIGKGHGKFYREAAKDFDILPPIFGGKTRQESVFKGLIKIAKYAPDKVLIHDAARPFVSAKITNAVVKKLKTAKVAVPVIVISDTVKCLKPRVKTLDKANLALAQTPQGFDFPEILAAHHKAKGKNFPDDAAVVEYSGIAVSVVPGEEKNYKITTPYDLEKAKTMLGGEIRVGSGFDIHAFGSGNHVTLCGVKIPHNRGLIGHSDADVGLHALTDALLGSIGAADIGEHFPPSDKKWKNADSAIFLRHAATLIAEKAGRINNIDVTIIAESPKISPHREKMRAKIAAILQIPLEKISVKATTTEGLGFIGRSEGVAAQAVVVVEV